MIRVAIMGYGNLGRGTEAALRHCPDLSLAAIFTRRPPAAVTPLTPGVPVLPAAEAEGWADAVDVMILCAGSAADLPRMTPEVARHFHTVDSFDTHAAIGRHFSAVDEAARAGGRLALISAGWDPGLFSLLRLWAGAFLPEGQGHTFWGPGISQGHSDALRRVPGVADGRQYTLPLPEAVELARRGGPPLPPERTHRRRGVVVPRPEGDRKEITRSIRAIPHYFAGYDTEVEFLSAEELEARHGGLPHGGRVIAVGEGGTMEFSLSLTSNPRFTGGVLAACARAVFRMAAEGRTGCITVADLPPALLSPLSRRELTQELL